MKLGLAPLTLFRPPQLELVRCAGEAGYDAVGFQLGLQEVPVSPLASDPEFIKQAKAELARWDLEVMEVSNIVFEPERTFDEGKILIDFAVEVGASIVQATVWDEERNRVIERLGSLANYAQSVGLGISVEYMPYSRCTSFDDALSIAQGTGQDNVHIVLDTLHFIRSGGSIEDLELESSNRYAFVQLCDAHAETPEFDDLRYESVWDRLPLGEGAIPLLEVLQRISVDLPISLEIPCQRLKDLPLVDQAREHLRIAREFITPVNARWMN